MKIKQLLSQVNKSTFIQDYLVACGVNDIQEYLMPTGKYVDNPMDYENIDKGLKLINNITTQSNHIYIVQDCDTDGICSATLMYRFLLYIGINPDRITVLFHDSKKHGLSDEIMDGLYKGLLGEWSESFKPLIIIPDAGTNDVKQCKELTDLGCRILIIDHHDKEIDNPYAIIINNQTSPDIDNKDLCGTGVVWKFMIAYSKKYLDGDRFYLKYTDLVTFANLADVMDMRSYENKTISDWAVEVQNPFLERMCYGYIKSGNITPKALIWQIIPKLNAVCRLGGSDGDMELKRNVFKAFTTDIPIGEQTFYGEVTKALSAAYSKQKRIVKEIYEGIISKHELSDNKVEIITIGSTPYTGLIASKLMDYYNKPVLLVHENEDIFSGSLRSPYPLKDTLNQSNLMLVCQGHEQACGVAWKSSNTKALIKYCNSIDMPEPVIEVCCSYKPHKIPHDIFGMFDEWDYLYATGVPYPKFHIAPIRINSKDIKILGANKTTIKFTYQGIDYIKFFVTQAEKEKLYKDIFHERHDVPLELEIIGELQINVFHGKQIEQVLIDRFECRKYKPNLNDLW